MHRACTVLDISKSQKLTHPYYEKSKQNFIYMQTPVNSESTKLVWVFVSTQMSAYSAEASWEEASAFLTEHEKKVDYYPLSWKTQSNIYWVWTILVTYEPIFSIP